MKTRINGKALAGKNHRFGACWAGAARTCCHLSEKFGDLKNRLMAKLDAEVRDSIPGDMIRLAVIEAEALAWATPFPLLFLPVLVEEKALYARNWATRQEAILSRQRAWAAVL